MKEDIEKGLELGLLDGERQSGDSVEILRFQHMPHVRNRVTSLSKKTQRKD